MYKKRGILIGLIILLFSFACITQEVYAAVTPSFGARNLKTGMRGGDVQDLQKALNYLGYPTETDGIFGPSTKYALMQFQKSVSLQADGIGGAATFRALNDILEGCWYEVKPGDNLSSLAKTYRTSVQGIMATNGLTRTTIKAGEKLLLTIGSEFNRAYIVQRGDNLSVLAKRFGVSLEKLLDVNSIEDPEYLCIGQQLLIPQSLPSRYNLGSQDESLVIIWPVTSRRITSGYGWRPHPIGGNRQFHGGIDIGVSTGTSVYAAAAGRVKSVGRGWQNGYGNNIVLDHGRGITTWYGHLSEILVKEGQWVTQGQQIAKSGNTGMSTGPHLDFRIKIGDDTIDPLKWLP